MNELERITAKYLIESTITIPYSDFNQEEVNKMFLNMISYERPDILSIYDNKIVAIEHFEFDSYKRTRKGSDFKRQYNMIGQNFDEEINTQLKEEGEVILDYQIENTSSLEQYYENFRNVLLSHIVKIPEYKKHIINEYGNKKDIKF